MVFEAIVVDLLNKFLNQYVENLNTSQLKFGIWGGDVTLDNLVIKPTIFKDLNLPFKVACGKLGKLTLKIPWKNLYGESTSALVEDLYILFVPNMEMKYDAQKEEKWYQDKKQQQLKAMEEAKKRELEEGKGPNKDSFVEKLTMQIVKTIEIEIRKIHIRYEDKTTDPQSPFSIGATMSTLTLHSTNVDPFPPEFKKSGQNIDFIFKTIRLEGLSIYWNTDQELINHLPSNEIESILLRDIPSHEFKPKNYKYVFGPLIAKGSLRLNPKPESDGSNFATPKIFIFIDMEEIKLAASRKQYKSITLFGQNLERLSIASKYRKYRPDNTPVIGHAKTWWHFAYACVTESIKRRKKEWSWDNILKHRNMCKQYQELFRVKLTSGKKVPKNLEKDLGELEKNLDVFNLILLREKVYVEEARNTIAENENKASSSWYSYWFGSSTKSEGSDKDDLVSTLEKVMTTKEKEKLYKAIDYKENYTATIYPDYFVEFKFLFKLKALRVRVFDDKNKDEKSSNVLSSSLLDVKVLFEKRPSANAIKLNVSLGSFTVLGMVKDDKPAPELVRSNCKQNEQLVDILFETNPLDGLCDQRIHVYANSLSITYNAVTVNTLREIFRLSSDEGSKIVAATAASLPTFQEVTSIGLEYAISKSSKLEVRIHVLASLLIIPYNGVYDPNNDFIIVKLGQFDVSTEERADKDINVKKLHLQGSSEKDIFSIFVSASYRKFKCQLMGIQILYRISGEQWANVLESSAPSPLRLLEPTNLTIIIKKSLVTDDARIPKVIIEGNLPSINVNASEDRVICLAALISSIPMSNQEPELQPINKRLTSSSWSLQSFGTQFETKLRQKGKVKTFSNKEDFVQGIDLVARFEMNEFVVNVSKATKQTSSEVKAKAPAAAEKKFLQLNVLNLNCELSCKTFENSAEIKLGAVEVWQNYSDKFMPVVATKQTKAEDGYLLLVEFSSVDTKMPGFFTKRNGIITMLKLNFTSLDACLHREAMLDMITFATYLQNRLQEVNDNRAGGKIVDSDFVTKKMASIYEEGLEPSEKKVVSKGRKFRKKKVDRDVIDLMADINMHSLNLKITSELRDFASLSFMGGKFEFSSRKAYMNVDCRLSDIILLDLNPNTRHNKILSCVGNETLSMKTTIFNKSHLESNKAVDLSFEAEMGRIRFVFLNFFISSTMEFFSVFQKQSAVVKSGATAAAQKAKEEVIKAYENETKICLNVKIMAPLIVFPRQSNSSEVILVDMGILTVKSFITELEEITTSDDGGARTPLMDVIRCHLENVKLSRAFLTKEKNTSHSETTILEPITFELTVNRNLSVTWYKEMVPLEIHGRLGVIHITLSNIDLNFIVHALQENFSEGVAECAKDRGDICTSSAKSPGDEGYQEFTGDQKRGGGEGVKSAEDAKPSIVFWFLADRFIFDSLTDCDDAVEGPKQEKSCNLARFVLEVFSLKGTLHSNQSITVSAYLSNIILDDTRPGKQGRITNLMAKKPDESGQNDGDNNSQAMLNLNLQKNGNDAFVDIRVYGFNLVLSMDFISKLSQFFSINDASSQQRGKPQIETKRSVPARKLKDLDGPVDRLPTLTFNVRVEKPDIIIVESMDSPDSEALIFNTELLMKYRRAGDREVITGTLSDISLFSSALNAVKKTQGMAQIIKPFTISIAGSSPDDQGLHLDICLTEIHIFINAKTIELINNCRETLMVDSTMDDSSNRDVDFSHLWKVKNFSDQDYWFLKTEEGVDALLTLSKPITKAKVPKKFLEQMCLISVPAIVVTIEGIRGKSKFPLLLFEMSAQGQITNWSSQLSVDCLIKLQMQYFNKSLSAWEPIIEPKEVIRDKQSYFIPWELDCNIVFGNNQVGDGDSVSLDDEQAAGSNIVVTLSCSENLEITLSKTCVEIFQNIADAFTAVSAHSIAKGVEYPPFIIKNQTGLTLSLLLEQSGLQPYGKQKQQDYKIVVLESGAEIELQEQKKYKAQVRSRKVFVDEKKDLYLHIKSDSFLNTLDLPISRTVKRYYPLNNTSNEFGNWELISDINTSDNSIVMTLRSILQIENCFQEPIVVHGMSKNGRELILVGTVEGNSVLNVPFHLVYGSINDLYFSVKGHSVTTAPVSWKNIKSEVKNSVLLRCNPNNTEDKDPFLLTAVGELESVYYENTYRRTISSMCIYIKLEPTFELLNCLPVDLVVCTQGNAAEKYLSSAERYQITSAEPGVSAITLRIENYLEKEWSCKETIPEDPSEITVWTFTSYSGMASEKLNVGVLHSRKGSTSVLTIYAPYLMVNRTGLLLSYRFDDNSSVVYHPASMKQPVMFSSSVKKFFSKKKALMKVNHGEWSDKFPVDVAGSGGTIECYDPASNSRYLIAITITLTFNNLSKIVLLSPYYVILNKTNYDIQCREHLVDNQPWITIESGSCSPMWPVSENNLKSLELRIKGTKEITPDFYYDGTDTVLLPLNNKYGGLFVDIQTTNAGTNVVVYPYESGLAPALILNHTDIELELIEKGTKNVIKLLPHESVLYTWKTPTEERKLVYYDKNRKEYSFSLKEDFNSAVSLLRSEGKFVSFLDGTQRILLFTSDAEAGSDSRLADRYENPNLEVILKIQGIGISLVNNQSQIEVLYIGCVSSGVFWETRKESRSRFRRMPVKDSNSIEKAYQKFVDYSNLEDHADAVVVIDNKIQVNFETMEMLYPHKRIIKRVFEPGLWVSYSAGENFITLHMKIYRLQIDNQLHDSIFPIVLFPMPPPKTVAVSDGPKPFFELSLLKVSAGQSRVQQYKYFRILVQEFNVKVDMGIISQLWNLIAAGDVSDEEYKAKFKKDITYCEQPLLSFVMVSSTNEQKNFYDLLHFSPLKVHFSFSVAGNIESSLMPTSLSVFLQSLGVTLTDFHDVLFRLSYFERKSAFLTQSQLQNEVVRHYYGQAIRQAYVLLLGLDVIGNPFGLVIGIGQGVEAFFYEPVQGIIQGPSDFATGVALGCRSLFGHTVGGTAGTLGRITGTLGKGLAVLSLDKEYQRERMEQQNRRTDTISTSMAQGGKGVVMGVYEGVTGVVMKPITGAKEEGVGGFFKGVGKGMMGLVTRPVTGVIDFASTSLNAVKRATELNVDCKRLRPPRYFQDDKLVLPYKIHEATGNNIFMEIEKKKYSKTDKYEYHAQLRGKEILMLTDKRLLLVEHNDVFGQWQVHMDLTWLDMANPPKEHAKGIAISVPRKKANPVFQTSKDVKILAVDDLQLRKMLFEKMTQLYYLETLTTDD